MIDKKHFLDNYSRDFVPYKGFYKILEDGSYVKDENTSEPNGPFEIICDPISHGNWHTLYNLRDNKGEKLLSKGIRTIKYYGDFYLLEDNNEDELIHSGEVKGGFNAENYRSHMNVMLTDGTLLFDEWFKKIEPLGNYFRVYDERGRAGYYSLSGDLYERNIFQIKFRCTIKPKKNVYSIFNSLFDELVDECTSVMWSSEGMWIVELLHNGEHKVYFHGQGGAMIRYAHEILIKPTVMALVEKDGMWYAVDSKGMLTKQFKWEI